LRSFPLPLAVANTFTVQWPYSLFWLVNFSWTSPFSLRRRLRLPQRSRTPSFLPPPFFPLLKVSSFRDMIHPSFFCDQKNLCVRLFACNPPPWRRELRLFFLFGFTLSPSRLTSLSIPLSYPKAALVLKPFLLSSIQAPKVECLPTVRGSALSCSSPREYVPADQAPSSDRGLFLLSLTTGHQSIFTPFPPIFGFFSQALFLANSAPHISPLFNASCSGLFSRSWWISVVDHSPPVPLKFPLFFLVSQRCSCVFPPLPQVDLLRNIRNHGKESPPLLRQVPTYPYPPCTYPIRQRGPLFLVCVFPFFVFLFRSFLLEPL